MLTNSDILILDSNKIRGGYYGYFHNGKIPELSKFYSSMRRLKVQIGTFIHEFNGVYSDVIFDTRNNEEWSLILIKRSIGATLTIPVRKGFRFTIDGDGAYRRFITYFSIAGGKGHFSIKEFVTHFSHQVPTDYNLSDEKRKVIIKYDQIDSSSDGIYPIGLKNWAVIHAKNPNLPSEKYHRTKENLMKTKELYPSIYEVIKDKDITVIYGTKPTDRSSIIQNGIIG